jgi:hypothetical protein
VTQRKIGRPSDWAVCCAFFKSSTHGTFSHASSLALGLTTAARSANSSARDALANKAANMPAITSSRPTRRPQTELVRNGVVMLVTFLIEFIHGPANKVYWG